jgi:hypothetical protein
LARNEGVHKRKKDIDIEQYKRKVFLLARRDILKKVRFELEEHNWNISMIKKKICIWIKQVKIQ